MGIQTEEVANLSHYILKDRFTAWEIACLVAGIDPASISKDELWGTEAWGRVRTIEDAVERAHNNSTALFFEAVGKTLDFLPDVPLSGAIGPAPWDTGVGWDGRYEYIVDNALPSVALRLAWSDHCGERVPNIAKENSDKNPEFYRGDIKIWLGKFGYTEARYFTSEPTPSEQESAEVKRLRARVNELEVELTSNSSATNRTPLCDSSLYSPTFTHETRGLRLVAAVQERYLGLNYDPKNADTRPPKAHVIEWLRSEKGVSSDKEADAIDRIAMPFDRGR